MLLLEQVLVLGARLDDRRHVDVVERRQQRRRVLRFLQAVRDRLAQARHLHALFVALAGLAPSLRGCGAGCGRSARLAAAPEREPPAHGPGRRLLRLRGREHVVLGQAAVLAGAPDLARVDMMLEHRAANRRRQRRRYASSSPSAGGFGRMLGPAQLRVLASAGGIRRRIGGLRLPLRRSARRQPPSHSRRCARSARRRRPCRPRSTSVSLEHAGDRRRNVDADLVGLESRDRLVRGDRLARLLQPLRERAFGDRFPKRGNCNVSGHDGPSTGRRRPGPRRGCYGRARPQSSSPARRRGAWRGRSRAKPRRRGPHRRGRMPLKPASARHCSSRSSTKNQAPLFFGSSCAQTSVFQLRHGLEALDQRLRRERIELLDPDDLGRRSPAASRASISS